MIINDLKLFKNFLFSGKRYMLTSAKQKFTPAQMQNFKKLIATNKPIIEGHREQISSDIENHDYQFYTVRSGVGVDHFAIGFKNSTSVFQLTHSRVVSVGSSKIKSIPVQLSQSFLSSDEEFKNTPHYSEDNSLNSNSYKKASGISRVLTYDKSCPDLIEVTNQGEISDIESKFNGALGLKEEWGANLASILMASFIIKCNDHGISGCSFFPPISSYYGFTALTREQMQDAHTILYNFDREEGLLLKYLNQIP